MGAFLTPRSLSPRLQQLLRLAAEGLSDKEIAGTLNISPDTVETHWKRLRSHFECSSRTQIVARVLRSFYADEIASLKAECDRMKGEVDACYERIDQLRGTVSELEEALRRDTKRTDAAYRERDRYCTLNRLATEGGVVFYISECGPPWRKLFFSDGVRKLGYDPDDLVSGKILPTEFIIADDVPDLLAVEERIKAGDRRLLLNYRVRTTDGQVRTLLDFCQIQEPNEEGRGVGHTVSIDITDWSEEFEALFEKGILELGGGKR